MMEERRKDEATWASEPANPLAMLDQLGDMVKATGKTSEQLIGEHLAERIKILTPSAFVEKYINV